jgi:hypothetical protein
MAEPLNSRLTWLKLFQLLLKGACAIIQKLWQLLCGCGMIESYTAEPG